jgi:hypothetical protein
MAEFNKYKLVFVFLIIPISFGKTSQNVNSMYCENNINCFCSKWSKSLICFGEKNNVFPFISIEKRHQISYLEFFDSNITYFPILHENEWPNLEIIILENTPYLNCENITFMKEQNPNILIVSPCRMLQMGNIAFYGNESVSVLQDSRNEINSFVIEFCIANCIMLLINSCLIILFKNKVFKKKVISGANLHSKSNIEMESYSLVTPSKVMTI